jgi:CRISPR/Cas system Type II protein with McrA/HNH and RuvC-like nuclease domain
VTHLRSVLHGYQQGRCFYCGEVIPTGAGHVDHVIPRQFVQHDEPWNLVLAHALCNEQKSDLLPSERSIAMLAVRNEHLIASNHPLKQQLTVQLGSTPEQRRQTVLHTYQDAKQVMPHTWEQVRRFDPATDVLYQTVIRRLSQ